MNYYEMLLARKLAKGELPPNAYLLKTASGSLVSFSDGADLPMPSFICNIDAVQDLHGQYHPWPGGAGKNKLSTDYVVSRLTSNNVDIVKNDDGSLDVTIDGTCSGTVNYLFKQTDAGSGLKAGSYKAILIAEGTYTGNIQIAIGGTSEVSYRTASLNTATEAFTINNDDNTLHYYILQFAAGATVTGKLKIYPMICSANEDMTTWAPYENICPISGHTGVDAWVRGKNLATLEQGNWSFGNGTRNSTATNYVCTPKVECKPNTTYTASTSYSLGTYGFVYWDKYGNHLGYALNKKTNATPNNCYYMAFNLSTSVSGGTVTPTDVTDFQLEKGSTATTYEPYNPASQTIQVSWQTEAGEVFDGYVDLVSGVLTVTHKSQTGFTRGSQDSSNKLYNIGTISDMKAYTTASAISPYFVDSMFEKMSVQGARIAETPSIAHYNKALYVGGYIGKEAELDALLETLQVKYELETPITYQLTPQQIKSLKDDITNAWCSIGDVTLEYFGKGAE